MEEVFILGAARTPLGKLSGSLSSVPAPTLGAIAIKGALERAGVSPEQVDYTLMGNVLQAGVGQAPARQAAINAGIPVTASAMTVNKVCASGLTASVLGAGMIRLGDAEIVVAGGMENMSLAPHLLKGSRNGVPLGNWEMADSMVQDGLWCTLAGQDMASAAEAIGDKHGVTRQQQDAFALRSHQRAVAAVMEGSFRDEIVPVTVETRRSSILVENDEGPRAETSLEALSNLTPAFSQGRSVTAGNASQISDGAAAVILAGTSTVERLGLNPIAKISGYSHAGVDPAWLFEGPVAATRALEAKTGLKLADFDLVETNEAFAAQALANGVALEYDWDRVNIHGGAVALGHPLGASGARILVTLLHALRQKGGRRGLATICHGGGGGVALSVELV
ncbi:MAG: acetyl-CoA C-acetyltransferase [SAR202 cluster bacterium]|mgnify:FL=1|nr:acetyl-CoA C-acetyltransferase [SAR202 cluster bacterium]